MKYRVSRRADADLIEIYLYGVREFGSAHAEAYHSQLLADMELIAEYPKAAREQRLWRGLARTFPSGSHVIAYRIEEGRGVVILRIFHARQNWARLL